MIHDILIQTIPREEQRAGWELTALRYSEPLLHRIGAIQVVRLEAGGRTPFRLRERADEVWVLAQGQASFHWHDRRTGSPTADEHQQHRADQPTRVLAPFGVGFGVQAEGAAALLLRLATEESEEDQLELAWPEP